MTAVLDAPVAAPPPVPDKAPWWQFGASSRYAAVIVGGYVVSLAIFSILVSLKGAGPFSVYHTMIDSTLLNTNSLQQVVLRAIPIALAALAVAVPARAGLINVGGEGQLILGAVAATGIGVEIGAHVPGVVSWAAMCAGGALAGAAWATISAVMRTWLGASEAVTTLLLNFIANDIMLYLIYQSWKDPKGSGQPQSRPLAKHAVLPKLFGSQINLGLFIALAAAVAIWFVLQRTGWGFALRVVGGNREAARRSGLRVNGLLISSMAVGGALAGLGGALNLAGVETQLRPDLTASYGYIAFLASFLGRHQPIKVVAAAVLFSAIALSGNGLQITDGLDGAIVDVLLALIVAVPLVMAKYREAIGMNGIEQTFIGGVDGGTAILLPALGELLGERAGVVNLGTEGAMLAGALSAYAVTQSSGYIVLGLIAGVAGGALVGAAHSWVTIRRGGDQIASGLVLWFLALGLTSVFGTTYVGTVITPLPNLPIPGLHSIPWFGPILFDHDILVYFGYLLVAVIWFVFYRTRVGLTLRATGERPEVVAATGGKPGLVQFLAVTIGSSLGGLGGAQLSIGYVGNWFNDMTSGYGFVAVAVVLFAAWRPVRVLGGAYLFGIVLAAASVLQAHGVSINQYLLDAMPYLVTLLVLAVFARRGRSDTPEALVRSLSRSG